MMPAGTRFVRAVAILVASALSGTISLGAQGDPLANARGFYEAAAYEDALSALAQIAPDTLAVPVARDLHVLRALALLALGREPDAREAIERAVEADPLFVLDESAAAPRVRDFFAEVRRAHVPALIKNRYGTARAALAAKAYAQAEAGFAAVCTLVDAVRPTMGEDAAALGELRDLAQGFLDLSREALGAEERRAAEAADARTGNAGEAGETAKPAETAAPGTSTVAPGTSAVPPGTSAVPPGTSAVPPGTSAAAADPKPAQPGPGGASDDADTVAPVPLAQPLPPPQRLPGLAAGQIYRGAIEIDIDTNGMVSAVRLVTSIHPVYDVRLLDAARRWRYRPATRKGVAVPYTRVVNVELGPLE